MRQSHANVGDGGKENKHYSAYFSNLKATPSQPPAS